METELHSPPRSSIESLVNMMAQYPEMCSHLQVFLHRERENTINQDYEFLMVTNSTFGKVKVVNLNVEDQYVIVDILECATQRVGNVRIDFNGLSPKVLFICWKDVKNMVYADRNIDFNKSELLEFDY